MRKCCVLLLQKLVTPGSGCISWFPFLNHLTSGSGCASTVQLSSTFLPTPPSTLGAPVSTTGGYITSIVISPVAAGPILLSAVQVYTPVWNRFMLYRAREDPSCSSFSFLLQVTVGTGLPVTLQDSVTLPPSLTIRPKYTDSKRLPVTLQDSVTLPPSFTIRPKYTDSKGLPVTLQDSVTLLPSFTIRPKYTLARKSSGTELSRSF